MKGDYSLIDLIKQKQKENLKNGSQIKFEFFESTLPYETRTSLFNRLSSIRNIRFMHFVARNVILNQHFFLFF